MTGRGRFSYIIIFFLTASACGDAFRCYYCNSDADGDGCHNPMNIKSVRLQYCDNLTVTDNANDAVPTNATGDTTTGTYVCTVMRYISNYNKWETIRECQNRLIQNEDICSYLKKSPTTGMYSRNFTCSSCSTDLCNAAVKIQVPLLTLIAIALVGLTTT
ncbi:hypothetical protein NQ315_001338 [Exocentrus adspersus]|uniref:Protein sleepless n=1 Tax=Exocentrus adspersus TaxID=1586481 RepID=A0AAV8WFF7_9CUCU|nr:hypothetical protein NQ315_001338 [Exocentrus adspersus]